MDRTGAWYDCEEGKAHEDLFQHVRRTEEDQYEIHRNNLLCARLYSNRDLPAIDWQTHQTRVISNAPLSLTKENITKSIIDTAAANIAKTKPKACPVTKGASWSSRINAKKLDRYLYAQFRKLKLYGKVQRVFTDACVFGTGVLYWELNGSTITVDRVLPDEIIVDNRDCTSDLEPVELFHRTLRSRRALLRMAKGDQELIEKINAACPPGYEYTNYRTPPDELLVVIRAWRKPCDGEPGRYVEAIENATIAEESWDHDFFPFSFFRWSDPLSGFYGTSLAEEVMSSQIRLDDLNDQIQSLQDTMATPRVFVDAGSQIVQTHLDADAKVRITKFRGRKPEVDVWPAVSPEIYQERERASTRPYRLAGVSEMSAQSTLPQGVRLDSSKALREFTGYEDRRFALQQQRLEDLYLHCAQMIIEFSEMAKTPPKVTWMSRSLVEDIDWAQAKMDKDNYILQLEASSITNETPAGRTQAVEDMMAQGIYSAEEIKALQENPDIENEISLQAAGIEDINATIEDIETGRQPTPDPLQNLTLGIPRVHLAYLRARRIPDVPPEVLEDYRVWLEMAVVARDGIGKPQNPAPVQPPPMMGPPGMPGMPPGPPQMPGMAPPPGQLPLPPQ
jgi:hypothetical protein